MTNKDILEQYTAVLAECRTLEKELSRLRDKGLEYVTDAVSGCPDYPPYGVRSIQIAGIAQDPAVKRQIEQLQSKLDEQYKNALIWRNRAESILSSIADARTRVVLRYRYVDGLDWWSVADKTGRNETNETVKKVAQKYFKENG